MGKIILIGVAIVVMVCALFVVSATVVRADETQLVFEDLKLGETVIKGFELSQRTDCEIVAVGARTRYSDDYFSYGWILDADSRDVVWTMQDDCDDEDRISDVLVECNSSVRLSPGRYEVYYSVGSQRNYLRGGYKISVNDLGDIIDIVGDIFTDDEDRVDRFVEEDLDELMLELTVDGSVNIYTPSFERPRNAVVFVSKPADNDYYHEGFTLTRETDLHLYAIGEFSESYEVFVDGAWIVNAADRDQVWTMDKWNTDRAGGASKNRYFNDIITLPAGDYIAYYATDDSHDAGEWNSPPPGDPMNYGLLITTDRPDEIANVKPFNETHNEIPIVQLTKVRDDSFEKTGFTLHKAAKIRILALGERSYSEDELADYGWISEAATMDRVWEMTADNTRYAGGAAKNCQFDGVIDLPAGDYMVYFRTDDSHAYGDWNSDPPFDKRGWGISLFGIGTDFSETSFEEVDFFEPGENVLVNLTGLGDYEEVSMRFVLENDTPLKIIAVGEGKSREMYDYGWIENDETGEIVWEMTYRKTRHAGGADKNRIAVANLTLAKGEYTAYFVTDDSHSFEDFNASPPDNPERWGMIVTRK